MNIIEIMKKVEEEGALLIRPRKEIHKKKQEWQYDVKPLFSGRKKDWIILDSFTVGAMKSVYESLENSSKEKWNCIFVSRLVGFCWDHVK